MRIVVFGDFFLDKYLITDPELAEPSIETGLDARQVVERRCSPGAAGTVTNNLAALGVGHIEAVGLIGDDGEGYELRRELEKSGVRADGILQCPDRFTPTYTKPMVRRPNGEEELERLDIKNRQPLQEENERKLIAELSRALKGHPRAVILLDQVSERNCGVITDVVRTAVHDLALEFPDTLFFADSRERIGEFKGVTIKPNIFEAAKAIGNAYGLDASIDEAGEMGLILVERLGKPVYLTLGEKGILVCLKDEVSLVPAIPVGGPIDIVGAGDSATAGIVTALTAGATPTEAAYIGNLCAAVTVRKLGTTGTASPSEILAILEPGL